MLGLEKNGFIISIALSLLIGAVIFYYFNSKIRSVENALTKQNNILTSFIGEVQNDLKTNITQYSQSGPPSNDATEEAKSTAAQVFESSQKIIVSDDSGSDSDTESDSDDEYSDDDADNDTVENIVKVIDLDGNETKGVANIRDNNLVTVVDIEEAVADNNQDIKSISLSEGIQNIDDNDNLTIVNLTESEEESDLDSDLDETQTLLQQQVLDSNNDITPILEHSKPIVNDDTTTIEASGLDVHKLFTKHQASSNNVLENDTTQYSKMKVDELRKLVVDRNIVEQGIDVALSLIHI